MHNEYHRTYDKAYKKKRDKKNGRPTYPTCVPTCVLLVSLFKYYIIRTYFNGKKNEILLISRTQERYEVLNPLVLGVLVKPQNSTLNCTYHTLKRTYHTLSGT